MGSRMDGAEDTFDFALLPTEQTGLQGVLKIAEKLLSCGVSSDALLNMQESNKAGVEVWGKMCSWKRRTMVSKAGNCIRRHRNKKEYGTFVQGINPSQFLCICGGSENLYF